MVSIHLAAGAALLPLAVAGFFLPIRHHLIATLTANATITAPARPLSNSCGACEAPLPHLRRLGRMLRYRRSHLAPSSSIGKPRSGPKREHRDRNGEYSPDQQNYATELQLHGGCCRRGEQR